jgi:hypothetical protein
MQRVLRYDGLLPTKITPDGSPGMVTPDDVRAMKAYIAQHRSQTSPFDIVWEGETPGNDCNAARAIIKPYVDAGITWWMESRWSTEDIDAIRRRIKQGPLRLE